MIRKILAATLFVIGILLSLQGIIDLSKRTGVYQITPRASKPESSILPARITIPSLSIHLPVEAVNLQGGKWPTSEIGISFVRDSGEVGSMGNLIFYGHNWKKLLGDLHKIKIGENIIITRDSGQEYVYSTVYIATVSANDVSILADTHDERITLYTCSGMFDQKRLVVVAKRV